MRAARPTIDHVRRVVRCRVCGRCPYHVTGPLRGGDGRASPCETRCRLFSHLPLLFEVARQADPVVGRRHERLIEIAQKITRPGGPLRRNAYAVVEVIEEAMGD